MLDGTRERENEIGPVREFFTRLLLADWLFVVPVDSLFIAAVNAQRQRVEREAIGMLQQEAQAASAHNIVAQFVRVLFLQHTHSAISYI